MIIKKLFKILISDSGINNKFELSINHNKCFINNIEYGNSSICFKMITLVSAGIF